VRRGRKATGLEEIAGLPVCRTGSRVTLENRVARLFGLDRSDAVTAGEVCRKNIFIYNMLTEWVSWMR
jgi:hypothetical protein